MLCGETYIYGEMFAECWPPSQDRSGTEAEGINHIHICPTHPHAYDLHAPTGPLSFFLSPNIDPQSLLLSDDGELNPGTPNAAIVMWLAVNSESASAAGVGASATDGAAQVGVAGVADAVAGARVFFCLPASPMQLQVSFLFLLWVFYPWLALG